jgi:phage gp46-like protein
MSDAYINPSTGAYVSAAGNLSRDPANGLANAVYLRVMTPLGSWWADTTLGSRLHELQREKDVPRVQRLARLYIEQALQPLIDDGRVSSITVAMQHQAGRLAVRVELLDAGNVSRTFDFHVKVG